MHIIELNDENKHLLDNVAEGVFDHDIKTSKLAAFLECPRHLMALAVDDGEVIGMASAVEFFHPDKSPQLWINEVGVTPERRNQGIGRQLVQALLDIGQKRGCVDAWLGTEYSNPAAQRCFTAVPNGETPQKFLLFEWGLAGSISRENRCDVEIDDWEKAYAELESYSKTEFLQYGFPEVLAAAMPHFQQLISDLRILDATATDDEKYEHFRHCIENINELARQDLPVETVEREEFCERMGDIASIVGLCASDDRRGFYDWILDWRDW